MFLFSVIQKALTVWVQRSAALWYTNGTCTGSCRWDLNGYTEQEVRHRDDCGGYAVTVVVVASSHSQKCIYTEGAEFCWPLY